MEASLNSPPDPLHPFDFRIPPPSSTSQPHFLCLTQVPTPRAKDASHLRHTPGPVPHRPAPPEGSIQIRASIAGSRHGSLHPPVDSKKCLLHVARRSSGI